MRKIALGVAIAALGITGLTACGSSTTSTTSTTTKVANTESGGGMAKVKPKPQPKTDFALCAKFRTDLGRFVGDLKNTPDSEMETAAGGVLHDDTQRIMTDMTHARNEATSASDIRRFERAQDALSTLDGGLIAISTGDYSGVTLVSQSIGQLSAASAGDVFELCGGGSTTTSS